MHPIAPTAAFRPAPARRNSGRALALSTLAAALLLLPGSSNAAMPWAPGSARLAAYSAAGSGARGDAYRAGQKALDAGKWKEAAEIFGKLREAQGDDVDAAIYWQAYALAKDGRASEALASLRVLKSKYPESEWVDDADALELELRGPAAAAPATSSKAENDELKLYAINGLLQADPARAVPVLQKFLASNSSPELKRQALFVLGQTDSPQAREVLISIARGQQHPALQEEAIHMLGVGGGKGSIAALAEVYRTASSVEVKEAVLGAYMVADAHAEVLAIAQTDPNLELRARAVHQLGAMGANEELRQLYRKAASADDRKEVLKAMGISGDVDGLVQAAKGEQDPEVRRTAIRSLGITGGDKASGALQQLYGGDVATRRAVIEALFIQDNAKVMIALFRSEKDPAMRREIVQKLSLMSSPEATEMLMKMLDE